MLVGLGPGVEDSGTVVAAGVCPQRHRPSGLTCWCSLTLLWTRDWRWLCPPDCSDPAFVAQKKSSKTSLLQLKLGFLGV